MNQNEKKIAANIKVDRTLATVIRVYCKLNQMTMIDFTTKVLSNHLKDFEEQLNEMKKLRFDKSQN